MEEKYSIRYFAVPKYNAAAYRECILILYKKTVIICSILLVILIAMTVYDVFHPLNGIGKIIYGLLLVVPVNYLFMFRLFRTDYRSARAGLETDGNGYTGNEYIFHIYNDRVSFEKVNSDYDIPQISLSDKTLKVRNKRKYFFIYASSIYGAIPKKSLSEADKNALFELTEKIKNISREGLKTQEGSGQ